MTRVTPQISLQLHHPEESFPPPEPYIVYWLYSVLRTKPWNPPLRFADNPPDFGVRYGEFHFFIFKQTPKFDCGTNPNDKANQQFW